MEEGIGAQYGAEGVGAPRQIRGLLCGYDRYLAAYHERADGRGGAWPGQRQTQQTHAEAGWADRPTGTERGNQLHE